MHNLHQEILTQKKLSPQELEALRRMAFEIAHDINNQLGAIQGYSDIISETLDKSSEQAQKFQKILESTSTCAALTSKLVHCCIHGSATNNHSDILVFIVDDMETNCHTLQCYLESMDIEHIHCFYNPEKAIESIRSGINPSIIISDFQMPEMDGISFLEAAEILLPRAKLILLTGDPAAARRQSSKYPIIEKGCFFDDHFSNLIESYIKELRNKS